MFFHEDETINFVATLVHRNGGTYGMSRLSGLLKRQFPAHRQRIGSIRKWVERSDVMSITKQGSWIISLNEGRPRKGAVEEGPRQTVFYGVEDWIYFRPGLCMMGIDLLHRARRQLRGVLSRRLKGESTPSLDVFSECLAALPCGGVFG